VVRTLLDRAKTLLEMADGAEFYFRRPTSYDAEAIERQVGPEQCVAIAQLCEQLEGLATADHAAIEGVFQQVLTATGLKLGKLGPAVRIALTGGTVSPSIYDVVTVLGCSETVTRMRSALKVFGVSIKTA
ncbi:MAG: glutamate--tRNA ligase, partial [Desulfuromonadales bacterium]|nr:glutamate--tRNA ligase [Desulfuromonadales bacterium]